MIHSIYSVHVVGGSRWSKGYTEFYLTDAPAPTGKNPVMSVIVLQIGPTDELFNKDLQEYRPSEMVCCRICRVTYNSLITGYGIESQKGYLFQLCKYDISLLIGMCQDNIDGFLEGKVAMDINDSEYSNWNFQVSKG
jgi:hypothetical protein